jgi:hypothetical protein
MEQMPDELWLLTFRYLHRIEILYSFNNLNSRIQQMIISYGNHIDLTNVSSTLFRTFCQYVFHHQILSLSINIGYEQSELSKRCFLPLSKSLKSLTILVNLINDNINAGECIDFYLDQLHYFKQLTDLYIYGYYSLSGRLAKIAKYASSTLTNLSLICSLFLSWSDTKTSHVHLTPDRLKNLKSLTISSTHVKYMSYLSTKSVNLNPKEVWNTIIMDNATVSWGKNIKICSTSTTIKLDEEPKKTKLNIVFENLYKFIPAIVDKETGPMRRSVEYCQEHCILSGRDGERYRVKIIYRHPVAQYQYVAFIFQKRTRLLKIDRMLKLLQLKGDVFCISLNCAVIKQLNDRKILSLKKLKDYIGHSCTTYYFRTSFNIIDQLVLRKIYKTKFQLN